MSLSLNTRDFAFFICNLSHTTEAKVFCFHYVELLQLAGIRRYFGGKYTRKISYFTNHPKIGSRVRQDRQLSFTYPCRALAVTRYTVHHEDQGTLPT